MPKKRASKKTPPAAKPAEEFPWIAEPLRPLAEPIGAVDVDPQNARKHNDANLKAIRTSLHRFGLRKPIVANRANGQVEAGNGTLLAARALGWSHIAVVWVEDDPAAQTGFSIADNRTAELAAWDDALLAELLDQHAPAAPDLFDDLLMAELFDPAGKPAKGKKKGTPEAQSPWPSCTYSVVIDCRDEADQRDLLARMEAFEFRHSSEGRACRLLTSIVTANQGAKSRESSDE